MEELRFCRRCLIRDLAVQDRENYFQAMYDYIENLDIDIKVAEDVYEKRLSVCRECDMLYQGMCRKCGCYVEMRAAVKKNGCPGKKWQAER